MIDRLDICTTATLRPEILERTLSSFKSNLFHERPCRLILNIDPIGEPDVSPGDVFNVACRYFPTLAVHVPPESHRTRALKWVWSQIQSPFSFHLEDDWEMLIRLDIDRMLGIMAQYPRLVHLRLPKGGAKGWRCMPHTPKAGHFYEWNGDYFASPVGKVQHVKYSGAPALIRTSWLRQFNERLPATSNHEFFAKQLGCQRNPLMRDWDFGVYTRPDTPWTIRDIGQPWRRRQGYSRNGRFVFTKWVRI